MTAEIGILNRQAVALAADSAVTISSNGNEKILNSANKLFNLIKGKPVGFMVYGNGTFMGLPWEVIVDAYRASFNYNDSYPHLENICEDFINKLSINPLFSDKKASLQLVYSKMATCFENIIEKTRDLLSERFPNTPVDESMSSAVFLEATDLYYNDYLNLDYSINFTDQDIEDIYNSSEDIINELCRHYVKFNITPELQDKLQSICALLMCKNILFNFSGIVFAGYGDEEILPRLYHYKIEGIVNGKLKYTIEKPSIIDQVELNNGNIAEIVPFAQQEMVHSILTGMDPFLQDHVFNCICRELDNAIGLLQTEDTQRNNQMINILSQRLKNIESQIKQYQFNNFVSPIISMVGMLNKDELATMAENLVNITSFKRKFTTDSETVGGPIDVAVISKSDGFIWIKRKHYFESELNHSYFHTNKY